MVQSDGSSSLTVMQATNMSCQISGNKELCGPLAMDGSSMNLEVLFSGPSVQTMVAKIQEAGKILYTNLYDVQQSYCYLHPVLVAILAIKKILPFSIKYCHHVLGIG